MGISSKRVLEVAEDSEQNVISDICDHNSKIPLYLWCQAKLESSREVNRYRFQPVKPDR